MSAADETRLLRSENDRLNAEVERLRLYIKDLQINSPAQAVIDENERLRAALRTIAIGNGEDVLTQDAMRELAYTALADQGKG